MARARNSTSKHSSKDAYHSLPPEEEFAGKLFRVRDKDWKAVWGESLDWDAANKLKEQVVTRGKSKTARVESMDVADPRQGTLFVAPSSASKAKYSATGKPLKHRKFDLQVPVKKPALVVAPAAKTEPVVDGDQTDIDDLLGAGDDVDDLLADADDGAAV
jgi:hypothetical protein